MASKDKLLYFKLRARGEPIRMLYGVSGTPFEDERIGFDVWPAKKAGTPTGQLPLLYTEKGVINQSNVITRYVAKKLGLFGNGLWEETLHDMVMENVFEAVNELPKIYGWKVFKAPEPENSQEIQEEVKAKYVKAVNYIQSIAEKRGKKFIVSNEIGAADVVLYTGLEFAKAAFPDIMTLTPWVKTFTETLSSHKMVKKYLSERPESDLGI